MAPQHRPRVIFITCHLPFPAISGGRRRELELIKRLSRDFDIHLMVVSRTFEQDLANGHELEPFCETVEVHPAEPLPDDGAAPQVGRHRCPALKRAVARALERESFDLVHVEGFYLMQHVPHDPGVPVMLVEQNIEFELERQRARAVSGGGHEVHDLRCLRAELEAWRRASGVGVLTPEDRDMLLATHPQAAVALVPDGADHLPLPNGRHARLDRPAAPLLAFVANFGYSPNVDAALHLAHDILPRVRERVPDVRTWLVGTDPPPEVTGLADETVLVTGRVADVAPYIDAADVLVCPLRIGGGIKVKAIEALRRGRCLVSTSVGAQGLHGQARAALAVADDPREFAAAAANLLIDPSDRARREQLSAAAGRSLPTWDAAALALRRAYQQLIPADRRLAG